MKWTSDWRNWPGIAWILPTAIVLLWQWASFAGLLTSRILPAPLDVAKAGFELAQKGELIHHLSISSGRAVLGFLVGGSIAFALGLLNGASRTGEKLLDTSVQMIRNIPHLALIPLVILWFGIGEEAKIFLVALGVFFPVYINTFHGIRTVDPGLVEMGKIYGLGPWDLFWQVLLPGALPAILVGVRYALGVMWLTLIVAETIASDAGIGYMAMNAREFMQTDVIVFSILLYALLGKLADWTVRLAERQWLQWHPNYERA